ncbi:hypothetical protein ACHMW6_17340 [Pseudoduganella sp. UC29_106]|uniref:hypothetical protein n=1 Tax=Pseudoduganella sp. UC29_106 TaxID=3374553 RepID=UPI0037565124
MKTLTIKDLARTEELDSAKMASVRGGWKMNTSYFKVGDIDIGGNYDSSIDAVQKLSQKQSVVTATANESAFLGPGIHVSSNVDQDGKNVIVG